MKLNHVKVLLGVIAAILLYITFMEYYYKPLKRRQLYIAKEQWERDRAEINSFHGEHRWDYNPRLFDSLEEVKRLEKIVESW